MESLVMVAAVIADGLLVVLLWGHRHETLRYIKARFHELLRAMGLEIDR